MAALSKVELIKRKKIYMTQGITKRKRLKPEINLIVVYLNFFEWKINLDVLKKEFYPFPMLRGNLCLDYNQK